MNNNTKNKTYLVYIFITVYLILNLVYLVDFPFVHSDESWLSGLARNIAATKDYSATEPFFDIKDRYPHAIKAVFHSMQILFIKVLGYNIFSMRLISLIFGVLSLYFIYRLAKAICDKESIALGAVLLTAVDIQFIYASHFARQEIVLMFFLLFSLHLFFKNQIKTKKTKHSNTTAVLLGTIIGISIGIHPNSFIISLPLFFLYFYHIFITKQIAFRALIYYSLTVTGFALLFIGLSYSLDSEFLTHYSALGQDFQVFNPVSAKLSQFKLFYLRLYYQVSGTYYTPDIRYQFFFFPIILITSLGYLFIKDQRRDAIENPPIFSTPGIVPSMIISIAALNLGIIFIGRYNQTSVIFQFPLFYLLASYCIYSFPIRKAVLQHITIGLLVLALGILSMTNILPYLTSSHENSYEYYLQQIEKVVPPEAEVLANLNTEYYFKLGKLHDYRNLSSLKDKDISFSDYIKLNHIEYIIYPEEMDVIYEERPRWNGMYGTPFYYEDMKKYLANNCSLLQEFAAPVYGMRIVDYMGKENWTVKIYRVNTEQYNRE